MPRTALDLELTELSAIFQNSETSVEETTVWYLILSREQIDSRDLERAAEFLDRVESWVENLLEWKSELLRLRSIILRRLGRNDEAFQLLVRAYTAVQSLEDHWSLANISLDLGVIAANSGDYDGASVFLKRCLEHADLGSIDPDIPAHAHIVLAQAQLERGAMEEASYHSTQALRGYKDLSNHSRAASAASLLASVSIEKKDLKSAKAALVDLETASLSKAQLISLINLEAKIDSLEGRFDKAELRHDEAIRLSSEIRTERLRTNSIQLKCETLLLQSRADETLKLLSEIGEDAIKGYDLLSYHELRGKALEQIGNFKEAFQEVKKFAILQKELLSERASNALSRLRAAQEVLQAEREAAHFRERSQFYAKELSQRTSYLVQQNEYVNNVIDHIQTLSRQKPEVAELLKDIRKQLRELPAASFDWNEYLRLFDEIHPNALTILEQRYPDLTPMESKICSLVLAKLSNIDIGRLLAVSARTVENHRHRLRKKLGLSVDVDLTSFLERTLAESTAKKQEARQGLKAQ